MLANYSKIVRRAGALTAIAAAIMVAVSAALVGVKGLIGALIAVAIVAVFFGISILVVGRAARVSPQAMMVAALASYLVKIVGLAVIVSRLNGTTAFSTKTLGFVAIGCILVWTGAQAVTAMKLKMLYVEPVSTSPAPTNTAPTNTAPTNTAPTNTAPANTAPASTKPASPATATPEPEQHAAQRGE
jgi:ATP synthase protein I